MRILTALRAAVAALLGRVPSAENLHPAETTGHGFAPLADEDEAARILRAILDGAEREYYFPAVTTVSSEYEPALLRGSVADLVLRGMKEHPDLLTGCCLYRDKHNHVIVQAQVLTPSYRAAQRRDPVTLGHTHTY